jgi:hypothetical protein
MEDALRMFALEIAAVSETIPRALGSDIAAWKRHLSGIASDPRLAIFENGRFSRLMKGRLWFYLQSPPEFDSEWLIINELNRIGASFFRNPFAAFWKLRTGETVQDPTTILDQLCGDPLDTDEIRAVRNFAEITRNPVTPANHREAAAAVVEEFDDFYRALWKISREAADAKPALKTSDKSDKS